MARLQNKKQAAVTTGSAKTPGIPCAMVLTASFALSPGTGLSCPCHQRDHLADLASASGGQDHATSSSASAPFVRAKNSRAPPTRPSHPRLTRRDDRDTSLFIEAGWREISMFFRKTEEKFFAREPDSPINVESAHEFRFFVYAYLCA
jgi:hypothetical protein